MADPQQRPNPESFLQIHKDAGLDPFANRPLNILLTFEGGGAKGIVHLGAYREFEYALRSDRDHSYDHWPKYQLRGVSGTSIGALVAALIAVGYSSREMLPELPVRPPMPAKPVRTGKWPHWRGAISWLSWLLFVLSYSFALLMYSLTMITGSARSAVLDNACLNRVTDVFGKGVAKFFFLKWLITHPIIMSLALSAMWIGTLLLVYFIIENIYPLLHGLWHSWSLSSTVLDTPVWMAAGILKFFDRYAPVVSMILFGIMSVIAFTWGLRCLLRGLLTTKIFRDGIDRALAVKLVDRFRQLAGSPSSDEAKRKKLFERIDELKRAIDRPKAEYRKVVTFQMLRDAECCPLAMAATNVRAGVVELFSTDATPKVFVADAIAASAAVPLLFQAVEIEEDDKRGLYWDGGFTSNLPAWPYDAQREINPDLYTLTIEITGRVPYRAWTRRDLFRPFHDFVLLVTAAVFGARELETRRTRRAAVILDTAIRLLDFNMGPTRAHEEIEESRLAFRASLNMRAATRRLYADKCLRICQSVHKHLMRSPPPGITPRIRVSLLQPTRYGARALKTVWRFCSNASFRRDTDDRLLFRKETSIPGMAWATFGDVLKDVSRNPEEVIWTDPAKSNNDVGPRHRYTHRLLWEEIEWVLAVFVARDAITGRGSTDWVVVVDSNIPLDDFEFSDRGLAYHDIRTAIRKIASELWSLEESAASLAKQMSA